MRCERVAEGMARRVLVDLGLLDGSGDSAAHVRSRKVVPPRRSIVRVHAEARSRKGVLPVPRARCSGIFSRESIWKPYLAVSRPQIVLMNKTYVPQVMSKRLRNGRGQHRKTIFITLAASHDDLIPVEVNVLYAYPKRLGQSESGAVEQRGDEERCAIQVIEDGPDLLPGQHHRETLSARGSNDRSDVIHINTQNVPIEEQDSAERLVLRGDRYMSINREVIEELLNVCDSEFTRMPRTVEADVADDPPTVGLLGMDTEVAAAAGLPKAIE